MDYEIVWTDRALTTLEEVLGTVADDNPPAADRLRTDLLAAVGVLARLPFIGPAWERDRGGRIREILSLPYRVFYRVVEPARRVEVLLVWHSSRQEPRL